MLVSLVYHFYLQCAYSLRNGIYNVIHVRSIEIETETAAKSHIYQHRSNSALPCPALPCLASSSKNSFQYQMGAPGPREGERGSGFPQGSAKKEKIIGCIHNCVCVAACGFGVRHVVARCTEYNKFRFHRLMAALFINRISPTASYTCPSPPGPSPCVLSL